MVQNGTPYSFNALQKVDWDSGEARCFDFGPGRFTSEALFIPAGDSAAEDQGYLLAVVFNAHSGNSEVVIVDAADMDAELATIRLCHHVPYGFHGVFVPRIFG